MLDVRHEVEAEAKIWNLECKTERETRRISEYCSNVVRFTKAISGEALVSIPGPTVTVDKGFRNS